MAPFVSQFDMQFAVNKAMFETMVTINNMSSNPFAAGASMPSLFNFGGNFDFTNLFNFNFMFNTPVAASAPTQQSAVSYGSSPRSTKLGKDFLEKTKQVAQEVGCDYKDLLAVMNSESGLNPAAQNQNGGATGLIQFMPATARAMGTTTDAIKNMSGVQQLDLVKRYILNQKKAAGLEGQRISAGQLYSLIFLPARAKREVLTTSNEKYYTCNRGLDANHDGQITSTELGNRVRSKYVNESIFA